MTNGRGFINLTFTWWRGIAGHPYVCGNRESKTKSRSEGSEKKPWYAALLTDICYESVTELQMIVITSCMAPCSSHVNGPPHE